MCQVSCATAPVVSRSLFWRHWGTNTVISLWPRLQNISTASAIPRQEKTRWRPCLSVEGGGKKNKSTKETWWKTLSIKFDDIVSLVSVFACEYEYEYEWRGVLVLKSTSFTALNLEIRQSRDSSELRVNSASEKSSFFLITGRNRQTKKKKNWSERT